MADARLGSDNTRLGKYQLLRRLATGGMAELFLARAAGVHGFEKLVVLKRILPQHRENDEFIRMFLSEARLAATLHHPNIVQVYDIGEDNGTCFFTMEWVQGQDLRKLVRASRKASAAIPIEHILHIVIGIAAGLDHAHDKRANDGSHLGIVHRDVSPSNVLVTYDGAVKIVDFGIAKAASAQSSTVAGTLKGKIPYMSPEQCRGQNVDRRSDVFSIGTLLWEMTTGSRLFAGDNEIAILNRVAAGDVPTPSSVRPDYPRELERIVMRALQADPATRYQNAMDLQIDLEDFAREARLPVSPARMAKFMRELFAEEIDQAAVQLQLDQLESSAPLTQPQGQAGDRTVVETSHDLVDVPSELHARATPSPKTESDLSQPSVTRANHSLNDLAADPPRRRALPWVAGIVVAAASGVGSMFVLDYFRGAAADPPAVARAQPAQEAIEPVEPDEVARPQAPTEPVPPAMVSAMPPSDVPSTVPVGTVAPDRATDPVAPSTEARVADNVVVRSKSRSSGSRKKQPKRDPAEAKKPAAPPQAAKKPTWDPDDPMPPPS